MILEDAKAAIGKQVINKKTKATGTLLEIWLRDSSTGGRPYHIGLVDFGDGEIHQIWIELLRLATQPTPTTLKVPYHAVVAALAFYKCKNQPAIDNLLKVLFGGEHSPDEQPQFTVKAEYQPVVEALAGCAIRKPAGIKNLFELVFGRDPTRHEMKYMQGKIRLDKCGRCERESRVLFRGDGAYQVGCRCAAFDVD